MADAIIPYTLLIISITASTCLGVFWAVNTIRAVKYCDKEKAKWFIVTYPKYYTKEKMHIYILLNLQATIAWFAMAIIAMYYCFYAKI
jgi:hypothetical protein